MTCVVAVVDQTGRITMGADSGGFGDDWSVVVRADPKVFRKDDMLIGYTSSYRMGQLLRFKLDIPPVRTGKDPYEFMCTDFVDAVRGCFEDGGYMKKESEREVGGTFLVGWKGTVYTVESDYQVGIAHDVYAAVGIGSPYALGSLFRSYFDDPIHPVEVALACAEHHCAGVRGPYTILQLGPD
jgi:hypothetical protein